MSAFAQHDVEDAVVENGECAYCDTPALVVDHGDYVEGVYQVLRVNDAPVYLCGPHWLLATMHAPRENITHHHGVHTLYA